MKKVALQVADFNMKVKKCQGWKHTTPASLHEPNDDDRDSATPQLTQLRFGAIINRFSPTHARQAQMSKQSYFTIQIQS